MSIEDTLARAFDLAGERAAAPPPDFVERVLARQRRRQQLRAVRVTGLATVSLAAIAGVSLVTANRGGRPGVVPMDRFSFGPPLDLSQAKPVEEVWPEAVVRPPRRLPDGRDYVPVHWLAPDKVIVLPVTDEVTHPPVQLSTTTGNVLDVGGSLFPSGPRFTALTVGERRLYWVLSDQRTTEVRAMSWTDTVVATVARYEHQAGDSVWFDVVEAGDTVYLVAHRDAGVTGPDALEQTTSTYRVEVGELMPVAGTTGWFPAGGPWLRASRFAAGRPVPGAPSPTPPQTPQFWNLATGERRTPMIPPGWAPLAYGPDHTLAQRDGVLVAYRPDGSGAIAVSGRDLGYAMTGPDSPGRFVAFFQVEAPTGAQYLWDLRRNRIGRFGADLVPSYDGLVLSENAAEKLVLDLGRIV